jgi:hypothetical protein
MYIWVLASVLEQTGTALETGRVAFSIPKVHHPRHLAPAHDPHGPKES